MKYLAQVNLQGNLGSYSMSSDSLDEIRAWAKSIGSAGDTLFIMPNGKTIADGRSFTL